MNCSCYREIQDKVKDMKMWKGKKIENAVLDGMFTMPKFEFYTSSNVILTLEGVKKKAEVQIRHSYCPFCGKKQDELPSEKPG